ncbi:MAG: site-specific integrase [Candidatus Omnitrophota bacterium]
MGVKIPEVESFFGYLLTERGLSQNTISAYQRDINKFNSFLEKSGTSAQTDSFHGQITRIARHLVEASGPSKDA